MSSAWVSFQCLVHLCETLASVHKSVLASTAALVWACKAYSLAKSINACSYFTWVCEGYVFDEGVHSVHGLLSEEADVAGVVGCKGGLCESQYLYEDVMTCIF